jgi:hypothetical protein
MLAQPSEAVSSATEAVTELRWRLAVLSDCYSQHGDKFELKVAAETAELLERIQSRLDFLSRGHECTPGE